MIQIVEVGPRDGLQNEAKFVPTEAKVAFVNALSATGTREIEVTAFVSPRWVPQLRDAEEVCAAIERRAGVTYSALVPNMRGLDRAMQAQMDKIAVFTAASDTFNQRNINTDIAGSFERLKPVVEAAGRAGLPTRGYVSTAFWCPYEERMAPAKVRDVALRLLDLGVDEISFGDTVGRARPDDVKRLLECVLADMGVEQVAMHFHDTFGTACDNVLAAWCGGVEVFDACVGGIGGCPYAPGAAGNVATSAVVQALQAAGAPVVVKLAALKEARRQIAQYIPLSPHLPVEDP